MQPMLYMHCGRVSFIHGNSAKTFVLYAGSGSVQGVASANAAAFAKAFSSAIASAFAKAKNGQQSVSFWVYLLGQS